MGRMQLLICCLWLVIGSRQVYLLPDNKVETQQNDEVLSEKSNAAQDVLYSYEEDPEPADAYQKSKTQSIDQKGYQLDSVNQMGNSWQYDPKCCYQGRFYFHHDIHNIGNNYPSINFNQYGGDPDYGRNHNTDYQDVPYNGRNYRNLNSYNFKGNSRSYYEQNQNSQYQSQNAQYQNQNQNENQNQNKNQNGIEAKDSSGNGDFLWIFQYRKRVILPMPSLWPSNSPLIDTTTTKTASTTTTTTTTTTTLAPSLEGCEHDCP